MELPVVLRKCLRQAGRSAGVAAAVACVVLVLGFLPLGGGGSGSDAPDGGSAQDAEQAATRSAGSRTDDPSTSVQVPPQLAGPGAVPAANGTDFAGLPSVGVLYAASDSGFQHHFCTASVVNSPGGDLLVTAAHCVMDPAAGNNQAAPVAFVPGYHDGQHPWGVWTSTAILVDPHWRADSDPDDDVAFVVVHDPSRPDARLQDVVGAEGIAFAAARPVQVGAIGYPSNLDRPVACVNTMKPYSATQSEFDCGGFAAGSSGGPLLRSIDPVTGRGTVLGVIGGYEEGGNTDAVSYASVFGSAVEALYQQAAAAG